MNEPRGPHLDRRLLGDLLVEAGVASRRAIGSGLEEQRLRGGRLGYNLLKLGLTTQAAMHLFLKDHFEILAPEMAHLLRTSPAVDVLPARLAHHYGMVPVQVEDGVLALGMATADLPALLPAVEELTGLRVDPIICPPSAIAEALKHFYPSEAETGVLYRPGSDHAFVLSDHRLGIRPALPELLRSDTQAPDRLRAILAEAVRRGARRIRIEPRHSEMRLVLSGRRMNDLELPQPRGAFAGLARLIEGLSGLAWRGRVVPREGRFLVIKDDRRLAVTVGMLPGIEGDTITLDLREERIEPMPPRELAGEFPDLALVIDRLAEEKRGILIAAGSDAFEAGIGIERALALLGERCPKRADLRGASPRHQNEEGDVPFEVRLGRRLLESPEVLLLPDLTLPGRAAAAIEEAGRRIVIASIAPMVDACAAVEWLGRSGLGTTLRESLAGVLGTRLMERLCASCRQAVDPFEFLLPAPPHRRPPAGSYGVSQGCASCRSSGLLHWQPVIEFLRPAPGEEWFRPPIPARVLREERGRQGMSTLFLAGLSKAASGIVDFREPLRLLLHES